MRHYSFYILFVAVLTLTGCADFLDRDPLEQASANTFWKTIPPYLSTNPQIYLF